MKSEIYPEVFCMVSSGVTNVDTLWSLTKTAFLCNYLSAWFVLMLVDTELHCFYLCAWTKKHEKDRKYPPGDSSEFLKSQHEPKNKIQ